MGSGILPLSHGDTGYTEFNNFDVPIGVAYGLLVHPKYKRVVKFYIDKKDNDNGNALSGTFYHGGQRQRGYLLNKKTHLEILTCGVV